jgi:NAD(P)-dependent dehydrogenase (short-subunit alcohol dehydrogenase family)
MLTWALAEDLEDEPVTANAVNPGYVLTPLTTNVSGPLRAIIVLTSFSAKTRALALHEATGLWDVAYADGRREVTPFEQYVHGFLGRCR